MNPTPLPERPEPPEGYKCSNCHRRFGMPEVYDAGYCPICMRNTLTVIPATRTPAPEAVAGEPCKTCKGYGLIPFTRGQTPESFEQGEYDCPDCAPTPPVEADKDAEKGLLHEPPLRIWLQYHGDGPEEDSPVRGADVCWCQDRVYDSDVEYIRLSRLPADWTKDSSLETWFPFTAQELTTARATIAKLEEESANKEATIRACGESRENLRATIAERDKRIETLVGALKKLLKLGKNCEGDIGWRGNPDAIVDYIRVKHILLIEAALAHAAEGKEQV